MRSARKWLKHELECQKSWACFLAFLLLLLGALLPAPLPSVCMAAILNSAIPSSSIILGSFLISLCLHFSISKMGVTAPHSVVTRIKRIDICKTLRTMSGNSRYYRGSLKNVRVVALVAVDGYVQHVESL